MSPLNTTFRLLFILAFIFESSLYIFLLDKISLSLFLWLIITVFLEVAYPLLNPELFRKSSFSSIFFSLNSNNL